MPPDVSETGRLLADVGGTNARFAWQVSAGAPLTDVRVLPGADFPTLQAAMHVYLEGLGHGRPALAAIAIANPITGDQVRMTNHHWAFSQAAVKAEFGLTHLRLLNDFTALALALPDLPANELRQIGGGAGEPDKARALLGAGTGLGVSGLLPDGAGGWVPLEGEGGHVTLPAVSARERLVMDGLTRLYGRASAERLCSGQGLVDTFTLLCEADGVALSGLGTAAAVADAALAARQPQALEALNMLCAMLGSVAGNLALTLGARGGVYIGGGIVPRLGSWFDTSPFRDRFQSKGRFQTYLKDVPVWVITSSQSPALLGAARALSGLR
ncbi:glucokinase [Hydrogenophaga sp.]|uniref:glucokinase n=1 Tax=Hydrogenophaga sp. TaxID=1904254 RepID=UPI002731DD4E|nr:glucokinase [Hydrogenophaga sp.]MDP2015943.1 glucokinase [Hydrogenophaga sp.]MDP3167536.1 glucokinase [Hydrogenophaga sp.]MDP3812542.1 glucokinase [Hydrogenophaga sp.]